LLLVILGLTAPLFLRSFLQIAWRDDGMNPVLAKDLSALVSLPLVFLFVAPILRKYWNFSRDLFAWSRLSWRIAGIGIAIGLLTRAAWWASVFFRGALFAPDSSFGTGLWPQWTMRCEPTTVLIAGVLSLGLLTPLIEETLHRGLIQRYLIRFGAIVGLVGAGVVFTLYHTPASWPIVFLLAMVLGVQYHWTGSLWPGLFTHITYNSLTYLDWHCLRGDWRPSAADVDLGPILLLSGAAFLVLSGLVIRLLVALRNGADPPPRPSLSR
jgi:membrane protease YdiL (CAAX protease family)